MLILILIEIQIQMHPSPQAVEQATQQLRAHFTNLMKTFAVTRPGPLSRRRVVFRLMSFKLEFEFEFGFEFGFCGWVVE